MKKESINAKLSPPEIHLISNTQALVDGAAGVLEYDGCLVRISLGCLIVKFCGTGLTIRTLSAEKMTVAGCISGLEFESV